jgi:hypothetical protein
VRSTPYRGGSSLSIVDRHEGRVVRRLDTGPHRERAEGGEHAAGDLGEIRQLDVLVRDAGFVLQSLHDRSVQVSLGGEVPVHRAFAEARALGHRRKVRACQSQVAKPWTSSEPARAMRSRVSAVF